jgi:hypothetical protein
VRDDHPDQRHPPARAAVSGARGGPTFAKTVLVSTTGHAYINERYTRPIWKYTVEFSEVLDSDVMLVRDLFMATRGGAEGFLFKDPRDYTATAQPIIGGSCIGATRSAARHLTARSRGRSPATRRAAAARPGPGTFLIPVRIDSDDLDLNVVKEDMAGIPSLSLIEVLE